MKILLIVSVIAVLTVDCRDLQYGPGNSDELTGQDQRGEERTLYDAEGAQAWMTELQDQKEQNRIEFRSVIENQIQHLTIKLKNLLRDTLTAANSQLDSKMKEMKENLFDAHYELEQMVDHLKGYNIDARCTVGFFGIGNQCFKLFTDTFRSWESAKSKCQAEGLQQAKPNDPITLRRYIFGHYGGQRWTWLGARGDGIAFKWERGGEWINRSSHLWHPGSPGNRVTTTDCLMLVSDPSNLKEYPTRLFFSNPCSKANHYALCEA